MRRRSSGLIVARLREVICQKLSVFFIGVGVFLELIGIVLDMEAFRIHS